MLHLLYINQGSFLKNEHLLWCTMHWKQFRGYLNHNLSFNKKYLHYSISCSIVISCHLIDFLFKWLVGRPLMRSKAKMAVADRKNGRYFWNIGYFWSTSQFSKTTILVMYRKMIIVFLWAVISISYSKNILIQF